MSKLWSKVSVTLLFFLGDISFRTRDYSEILEEADFEVVLKSVLYFTIGFLAIVKLSKYSIKEFLADLGAPLVTYVCIASLSVLYSPSIELSAFWLFVLLSMCIVVWLLQKEGNAYTFIKLYKKALLAFVVIIIYLILAFPDWIFPVTMFEKVRRLGGFFHPNALAILLALLGVVVHPFLYHRRRKLGTIAIILITVALVILTGSRMGMVSLLLIIVLQHSYHSGLISRSKLLLAPVIMLIAILNYDFLAEIFQERFLRFSDIGSLGELTGRWKLWELIADMIGDSIVLGHGFNSSRILLIENAPWGLYLHNAAVQALFDFGVVGLIVSFWMIFRILGNLIAISKSEVLAADPLFSILMGVLAFLILSSISEVSFTGKPSVSTLFLVYASITTNIARRNRRWSV